MQPKSIVFLGSKPIGYGCLEYLIAQREQLNLTIAGLLTRSRKEFGNAHDLNVLAAEHNIVILLIENRRGGFGMNLLAIEIPIQLAGCP